MTRCILLALVLGLVPAPLALAENPTLRVSPQIGMVPLLVEATLRVLPDTVNREICLWWGKAEEDEAMGSESCLTVEGASAGTLYRYRRTLREAGNWTFQGRVRLQTGRWVRSSPVTVRTFGGNSWN